MQNFSSQKLCHKAAVRRSKKRMQKHVQKHMQKHVQIFLHQTVISLLSQNLCDVKFCMKL